MQIKTYLARILMGGALLTAISTLPAMGQTNYPLRLRGSSGITTAYTNGNLFIQFQPGDSPAGDSLQPGQGSWLDRGLRPTEPNVLKQAVSEDEAKAIADYLQSETHFATFYCHNTDRGYFEVVNAETFVSGSITSDNATGHPPVVIVNGDGNSGNGAVVLSGSTGGWTGRDRKDRRDDHKDHRDDGKEHREVAKKDHDEGKDHHEKDHHEKDHAGTGNHGIALVKTHPKPLVKANPRPAPKVTKAPPRPSPKKKA
jgi:hypothetical protein